MTVEDVACDTCGEPITCPYCDVCESCRGLCADAAAVEREVGDPDAGRWWS